MRTEAITFLKEDVSALGQLVVTSVEEITRLLRKDKTVRLTVVEDREEVINEACQAIEEKCLDL